MDNERSSVTSFKEQAQGMRKLHLVGGEQPGVRPLTDKQGFRPYKVSAVGQMTLPASARQRWALKNGGRVEVADLGYAILVLPERGWRDVVANWIPRNAMRAAVAARAHADG